MRNKIVHLYWAWEQGANGRALLRETSTGFAVCKEYAPRKQLTTHRDDTTCRECLQHSKAVIHMPRPARCPYCRAKPGAKHIDGCPATRTKK